MLLHSYPILTLLLPPPLYPFFTPSYTTIIVVILIYYCFSIINCIIKIQLIILKQQYQNQKQNSEEKLINLNAANKSKY